jgi:hypothetical protein
MPATASRTVVDSCDKNRHLGGRLNSGFDDMSLTPMPASEYRMT